MLLDCLSELYFYWLLVVTEKQGQCREGDPGSVKSEVGAEGLVAPLFRGFPFQLTDRSREAVLRP